MVSNDKFNAHCSLTMAVPITSSDTGYPLHLSVGAVPSEDGAPQIRGFAQIEQLKSLDLESHHVVKVGSIDAKGMDAILSMVMSCLIAPDMSVISGF